MWYLASRLSVLQFPQKVKKSNKWKCKVCGERQSVRQVCGVNGVGWL